MSKCIVMFPPQWSPFSPHLAPIVISSNIKKEGHICDVRDFNVDFYGEILKSDYLKAVLVEVFSEYIQINHELSSKIDKNKSPEEYDIDFQIKAKKLLKITELRDHKIEETKKIINYVEQALEILKNEDAFYNLNLCTNSIYIIERALEIVSLREFPQEFSLYNLKNNLVQFNYENILKYCNQKNMFSDFYDKYVDEIISKKYDLAGISISSSTQLLSALTLAKKLKEKAKKTKILLGGNYISRVCDAIVKYPDFFKTFADYVIFEEGERSIKELLQHLNRKRNLKDVSSLIYLNSEGKVEKNGKKCPIVLSKLAPINLEGFNLKKYFLPKLIIPIQGSRGCYWRKCTFCDHDFGQTYNIKDVSFLVSEIKDLQDKYGIDNFEFTDEAFSPSFLEQFSRKVIEQNLKINWYCDLRLESAFSREHFELAYQAGLKMVLWGFESGSKRIMDLINKGVDSLDRYNVLRRAGEAGIFNFAYVFTGFPTETYEEALETINAVCNNTDIIHAYGRSIFTMGKHCLISENPEKFGIEKLEDLEDFSSDAKYIFKEGLSEKELGDVNNLFIKKAYESYQNPAWMHLIYREILFLYICKYGKDAVCKMKYE